MTRASSAAWYAVLRVPASGSILPAHHLVLVHTGRRGTLLFLGAAALIASAATAIVRRVVIDRGLIRNRPPNAVAPGSLTPLEPAHGSDPPARTPLVPPPATQLQRQPAPLQPAPHSNGSSRPSTAAETPLVAPELAWAGSRAPVTEAPPGAESAPVGQPTPVVATHCSSDASPSAEQGIVAEAVEVGEVTTDPPTSPAGTVRLHQITIDSLDQLAAKLEDVRAVETDLVLALPAGGALVLGQPEELVQAAQLVGGICVAASAVPLASPPLAERLQQAITHAVGTPVLRSQCFPHALFGPVGQLRSLLADLPGGDTDADRLTAAVLANGHEMVVDIVSYFFHLLDGTGTDVTIVAGRAHVGGKQPLVVIDPASDGRALASIEADLADRGGADLARLLRYDGAADPSDEVTGVADDLQVTRLWSPEFCGTVVRAAEVLGLWTNDADDASAGHVGVSLLDLIPSLLAHLEADLNRRIWPLVHQGQPVEDVTVRAAMVVRQLVGDPGGSPVPPHEGADFMGSVRLNDTYSGGALIFPRQLWDDSIVPVGALTLWPSGGSHPCHESEITGGVRYTLRLWLGKGAW